MHNIFRWYNQNRKKVGIIAVAIFIIGAIIWYWLNSDTSKEIELAEQQNTINQNALNSLTITTDKSVISGQKSISSEKEISVIDDFITYCNSGKIEEAYNLLSNNCKQAMYRNVNEFKNRYYTPIFGQIKRSAKMENWIGNIYKVDLLEDALSTGRVSQTNIYQDYITIVYENEIKKININKYIGSKDINKTETAKNIQVTVIKSDRYFDYEIYTFKVQNNSEKSITLGNLDTNNVSYLQDENELKYQAYATELTQAELEVAPKQTINIQIKYLNQYSSTRKIKKLVFPTIILNYEEYKNYKFGNNYGTTSIQFEL